MKIVLKSLLIFLLLTSTSIFGTNGYSKQDSNYNLLNLEPNQNYSAARVYNDSLSLLESLISTNPMLISYSTNTSQTYFGKAGLAGTGINLLSALEMDTTWVGENIDTRLLNLASELGDFLITQVQEDNSTHSIWSISNLSDQVDLSLEFGLLGIAEFFVKLYNHTSNPVYANYASKTMQSIYDLASVNSTDMFFTFDTFISYYNTWYPISNFEYYFVRNAVFSGLSYGAAGITNVALNYLKLVDIANTTLADEMIEKSLNFIERYVTINGTERAYFTSFEYPGLISTSIAVGSAGIGKLYLDLYNYYGDQNFLDNAIAIKDWFNGTTSGQNRLIVSWIVNDTIQTELELGIHMGLAGITSFLDDLSYHYNISILSPMVTSSMNKLLLFKQEDNNLIQFAERVKYNKVLNIGSTSYSFGGGGIYGIMNKIGLRYNVSIFNEYSTKAKNYLLSTIKQKDNLFAIYDKETFEIETNPMRGISGSLIYLSVLTKGVLILNTAPLIFPNTAIGDSNELSITVQNEGDAVLSLNWSVSSQIFSFVHSETQLEGYSSFVISISFTPLTETLYNDKLILTDGTNEFEITLSGFGFDLPSISSYDGPANNSLISSPGVLTFKIDVEDSSSISSVTMNLKNENRTSITSMAMILDAGLYVGTWDTSSYPNGTYILEFSLTDSLDNINIISYIFEIGFYTSRLEERIFSQDTFYGIIIASAVMLLVAIIITRRYRS
ncbi:MAG: hypothetical protein INQ03_01840 [Candidatus Heimdallarchaeota archaeon]|nr:hypothetical protein [Candidatus Heimdallarchaeota archaeon]